MDERADEAERKLVLTLVSDAAKGTRRLANQMAITPPEAVRRGLLLLDFYTSLDDNEELVVRNKANGTLERIRFQWAYNT